MTWSESGFWTPDESPVLKLHGFDFAAPDEEDTRFGSLSDLFEEEPVDLKTFIQDKKFLAQSWNLSSIQWEAVRMIERVFYPELYPVMAKEFNSEYWAEDLPVKNLIALEWGKGSSDPDTPVYDARTGLWKPLRDFKEGPVASAFPSDGKVFTTTGSDSFREGEGRMYVVKTRKGRRTRVWEGHRYLAWGREQFKGGTRVQFSQSGTPEWKRLWDLKVGDHIAISNFVPEPSETLSFEDRDVEMLGLFIGDGCMVKEYSYEMVCGVDAVETRKRISELFRMYPDTDSQETLDVSAGSSRWHIKPVDSGTRSHSKKFREVASKWSISGHKAATKHIPEEFFRADNRQIALLVSRLIDTDGWVSISNTVEVGYGTTSERLADDLINLLLRLGVAASKQTKTSTYKDEPYTSYQVRIRDRVGARTLLEKLTLLDKEPMRLAALEWLKTTGNGKVHATHGDLVWDTIESIEYDGNGEYWTLSVDGPASYISNGGVFDHNSGKDMVCQISSLRVAYLLLCMKSPQSYFDMPEFASIHMLNIAVNAAQAERAFFDPVRRAVSRKGGWFEDKAHPKRDSIQYDKNILAISGHSDAESQEGLNILLGVADEIDAFREKDEMVGLGNRKREASTSAESILKMIKGSAATRFPRTYKRVAISYPRYIGSTIQKQVAEGLDSIQKYGEDSIHYVSGPWPTWDVNPRIKGPEDFAEDYDRDPVEAASMYECRPARAVDGYFKNMPALRAAVDRMEQPITVDYVLRQRASRDPEAESALVWDVEFHIADWFKPKQGARYAMHADLAIRGDRAGIAMSHVETYLDSSVSKLSENGDVTEVHVKVPVVRNDFTLALESSKATSPPREIQIRWARKLAFELIDRGFLIVMFSFDQFQSADSMQMLNDAGVATDRISADINDNPYKALKDIAYDYRLKLPYNKLLFEELERLNRVGKKIDHPPGGCFVGETRIPLLDGTFPQISELDGKEVWVYSSTPEGKIVPGLARGRKTKETTELVDVLLDNGYVARCTPEHRWMLRDGTYREAKDLRPGIDRLMSSLPSTSPVVTLVSTVILTEPVPVYDLEVDEWSNFALSGGVFVHNSKDVADALACSIVGAIGASGEETVDSREVEIGAVQVAVGDALAPLSGMGDVSIHNLMPLGMNGMSLYGRQ